MPVKLSIFPKLKNWFVPLKDHARSVGLKVGELFATALKPRADLSYQLVPFM